MICSYRQWMQSNIRLASSPLPSSSVVVAVVVVVVVVVGCSNESAVQPVDPDVPIR